jgi:hypothetical protein
VGRKNVATDRQLVVVLTVVVVVVGGMIGRVEQKDGVRMWDEHTKKRIASGRTVTIHGDNRYSLISYPVISVFFHRTCCVRV